MLSGFRHHPYSLEHKLSRLFFTGEGRADAIDSLNLNTYADILAPDRLRAMKNSLICLAAVISRSAISRGVDPEKSFSVSDFYINEIETRSTAAELQTLMTEMIDEYRRLSEEAEHRTCSLPVSRAKSYIQTHIYGICTVSAMAEEIGYNPQYLASIFKKELGVTPSGYIRQVKMEEAKELLASRTVSVGEISASLGYCNASHFIREFKRYYGVTPKNYTLWYSANGK